jgi:hypothetical protein
MPDFGMTKIGHSNLYTRNAVCRFSGLLNIIHFPMTHSSIFRSALILLVSSICLSSCGEDEDMMTNDRCLLVPDPGFCQAAIPKYYYDQQEKKCKEFTWGGCGGVVPFETLEACKECE